MQLCPYSRIPQVAHLSNGVRVRGLWIEGAIHVLTHLRVGHVPQWIDSNQNSTLMKSSQVRTEGRGRRKLKAWVRSSPGAEFFVPSGRRTTEPLVPYLRSGMEGCVYHLVTTYLRRGRGASSALSNCCVRQEFMEVEHPMIQSILS